MKAVPVMRALGKWDAARQTLVHTGQHYDANPSLRNRTERPVTITSGTNLLVGHDLRLSNSELASILEGRAKKGSIPPLWDGHARERVAQVLQGNTAAVAGQP
jgi:UDP-N-acetylglucosamine 2-epimerase